MHDLRNKERLEARRNYSNNAITRENGAREMYAIISLETHTHTQNVDASNERILTLSSLSLLSYAFALFAFGLFLYDAEEREEFARDATMTRRKSVDRDQCIFRFSFSL